MRLPRVLATVAVLALAVGCTPVEPPDDTDAVERAETGGSDAQQLAGSYIGLPEDEALAFAEERGFTARVGTLDDVGEPGRTDDYEVGRVTLVVRDGVVAEVVVETETGPVTVAAG